jgi:hypothetical protein
MVSNVAARIADDVASQWQTRSRIAVLAGVIAVGYFVDYLFFRHESVGEFIAFIAFWAHIGLQIWLPEKVYEMVYRDTYNATIGRL